MLSPLQELDCLEDSSEMVREPGPKPPRLDRKGPKLAGLQRVSSTLRYQRLLREAHNLYGVSLAHARKLQCLSKAASCIAILCFRKSTMT